LEFIDQNCDKAAGSAVLREEGLHGQVVLVTGGAQGIGRAIADGAARAGARAVAIVGRDEAKGGEAARMIATLGAECAFIAADLGEPNGPDRIFDAAIARFGQVDALVNAAGLTDRGSLVDADLALWERLYAVNARAPFFLMQRLIRHLKARASGGAIVNILSMHAHGGAPSLAVYGSTKSALAGLTRNAAHAHRFDRIRVNGIHVGWVDTPAEREMQSVTMGQGEGWLAEAAARQPFGRLIAAEEVGRLALFLLSKESEPMTGALIDQEQFVIGAFG
jgi:NAD(P)-dependent dehydrogenase (short-subunit alcohol dehydrogenase family)